MEGFIADNNKTDNRTGNTMFESLGNKWIIPITFFMSNSEPAGDGLETSNKSFIISYPNKLVTFWCLITSSLLYYYFSFLWLLQ